MCRNVYQIIWVDQTTDDVIEVIAECESLAFAETIADRIHHEFGYAIDIDEVQQVYVSVFADSEMTGWVECGESETVLQVRT